MGSYTFGHLKKLDNQVSNYFITFTKRKKKKKELVAKAILKFPVIIINLSRHCRIYTTRAM